MFPVLFSQADDLFPLQFQGFQKFPTSREIQCKIKHLLQIIHRQIVDTQLQNQTGMAGEGTRPQCSICFLLPLQDAGPLCSPQPHTTALIPIGTCGRGQESPGWQTPSYCACFQPCPAFPVFLFRQLTQHLSALSLGPPLWRTCFYSLEV